MVLACTWSDVVLICMLLASFFSVYYTLSLTKKKKKIYIYIYGKC